MSNNGGLYVEYLEGKKHSYKNAPISDSHTAFKDCGRYLNDDELVIDIDNMDRPTVEQLINVLNIKTKTVFTPNGVHLYFKKPSTWERVNYNSNIGIPVEAFTHKNRPQGMTIKNNGTLREVINEDTLEPLNWAFTPIGYFRVDLTKLSEGDGRNTALNSIKFHIAKNFGLTGKGVTNWKEVIRFLNHNILADPLPNDELNNTILRDEEIEKTDDNEEPKEYQLADILVRDFNINIWQGKIYFKTNDMGTFSSDIHFLEHKLSERFKDKRWVEIERILERATRVSVRHSETKEFPIRFKNGELKGGRFIEIVTEDFTPYNIDVEYKANAEPVKVVNDYLNFITAIETGEHDPVLRDVVLEVLAHTFITDVGFKTKLAKMFLFIGRGQEGKSTLLKVIGSILGDHNVTNLSATNLEDDTAVYRMQGKLANLGDDLTNEPFNNRVMARMKNISSCDSFDIRPIYQDGHSVTLTNSLLFTTNHRIKSFEKGDAIERRMFWIPFYNKVDKENMVVGLVDKLTEPKALEYWISLIVKAYFRLYEQNDFTYSSRVDDETEKYFEENNPAKIFVEEIIKNYIDEEGTLYPLNRTPVAQINEEYEDFCILNDLNYNRNEMVNTFRKVTGMDSKVFKIDGHPTRCYYLQEFERRMREAEKV